MTLQTPLPADLKKIIADNNFTAAELGQALGFSDPDRVVRALTHGFRSGKPFHLSGPATKALEYMLALHQLVAAHNAFEEDANPETEGNLAEVFDKVVAILPKRLRP